MELSEISVFYEKRVANPTRIESSRCIYRLILDITDFDSLELQEEVTVFFLNRANQVLGYKTLFKGGLSSCVIDPKIVFGIALKCAASGIIVTHNHPSGNLKPSKADFDITSKIKNIGELIDIELIDHIIFSRYNHYSMRDEGEL